MQKIAGELKHALHVLNMNLVSMVTDPNFEAALHLADHDADTKAFLMVEALKGVALDPLTGETPEAFCAIYGDTIGFHIHFDRWVNFIGLFELPVNSTRAKQVMEAIEVNLNSKMFKAAKMHRRLSTRRTRLHSQAQTWASRAYASVLMKCGGRFKSQGDRDCANAAYNRVLEPRMARINARVNRLGDVAAPGFKGAYSEALANFLYYHLPYRTKAKEIVLG